MTNDASKVALSGSARGLGAATDAQYDVIQNIWGRGCLSPLDALFGAQAIMRLVPTKGFGFTGLHLGQRLLKYADDLKARVDAVERDATLTRLYARKKSSIHNMAFEFQRLPFQTSRYEAFIVMQTCVLGVPLDVLYGQGAASLKKQGQIFCADLMARKDGCDVRLKARGTSASNEWSFQSRESHTQTLQDAGLKIEDCLDLSKALLAAIRSGFYQSLPMLAELRTPGQAKRMKAVLHYLEQLETWGAIYDMVENGGLEAVAILATKVR